MTAESYAGTTVWDSKGEPIGLIAVIARSPLANPKLVETILQLVGLRVANELERKRDEGVLRLSEHKYRSLFEAMSEGFALHQMVLDPEGKPCDYRFLDVNPSFERLTGLKRQDLIGRLQSDILDGEDPRWLEAYSRVTLTGEPCRLENYSRSLRRHYEVFAYRPAPGQFAVMFVDITLRKRMEEERRVMVELLHLLNSGHDLHTLMKTATLLVRDWSGCQAVGVRLRDGEDYPYFETRGFPASFVQAENRLCSYDPKGQVVCDEQGNPILECMCGNVLSGRFDPAKSFFTRSGSFWTNSTTQLLATTTNADRQARTRNRCNREGYESVALIPLRAGGETFGLLQLNDKAPDRFSPEAISFLERFANSLALALAQERSRLKLRQSEERLRLAQDAAKAGSWEWDIQTGQNVWSDELWRLYGLEPGICEASYEAWLQSIIPEDRAKTEEAVQNAARQGNELNVEWRVRHSQGEERWLMSRGKPVRDPEGRVLRYLGIVIDITEGKQTETKLRASQGLYHSLVETLPQNVLRKDRAGRFTFANKRCCESLGKPIEDILGKTDFDFHPYAIAAKYRRDDVKVMESGRPLELVEEHRLASGKWSYMQVVKTPLVGFDQNILGVQVIFWDVTERRQAEEQVRKLSRAVDQSPVSIVITDPAGLIEYVNPKFTKVTGYEPQDVLGQNPRVLKGGHTSDEDYRRLWETIAQGHEWRGEFHNRKKNGELYWESASISPILDADGRTTHFLAVKEDITERKRLEEELRQALKMQAVGQLAGGVAHDFNNILAAIMMQLGMLRGSALLAPETCDLLQDLEAGAKRAANLVRQLLLFSRRSVMDVKVVDLNELVENLLKMLRRLIGENISIDFVQAAGLLQLKADPGMLEQVMMNLVVNARDAMPKGGRITIRTGLMPIDATLAKAHPSRRAGAFIRLSVTDTGCGMDESTLKRIFEPFFTTKEVGKGTGLGLPTVEGITAQHGGWVEVESRLGEGTSFHVLLPGLPAGESSPEAATPVKPSIQALRGTETILLVEDELSVRKNLKCLLSLLGYRVLEAANGLEARALWANHRERVDLLFTDMVMPEGITGQDLAHQFQAERPGLKVIISSGYSNEILQHGLRAIPGTIHLPKPYEAEVLAAAIRACIEGKDWHA